MVKLDSYFKKNSQDTVGVWLESPDTHDVHVLLEGGQQMVLGVNELKSGKMTPAFNNPAIIFDKEGVSVQYAGESGQPVIKEVDSDVMAILLQNFINLVKELYK